MVYVQNGRAGESCKRSDGRRALYTWRNQVWGWVYKRLSWCESCTRSNKPGCTKQNKEPM